MKTRPSFSLAVFLCLGIGSQISSIHAGEIPVPPAPEPIAPIEAPFPMPQLRRPVFPERMVDIREHGAVGEGRTLNTQAIARAIAACAEAGGGQVIVPAGDWLTGPIHLKSNVDLHLAEGALLRFSSDPEHYLPVVWTRWAGLECYNYSPLIYACDCTNIAVTGPGKIDAQGRSWWSWARRQKETFRSLYLNQAVKNVPVEKRIYGTPEAGLRPQMISPIRCKNVLLEGFTIAAPGPGLTIWAVYCENVIIRGLQIHAVGGPNTDGINLDSCNRALVEHCLIDCSDDCLALKSGYNEDGWRVGRACENVVIRHIDARRGHGGFVIGSETSGDIRNAFVHDCRFQEVYRGLRFKSMRGRGGVVENIWVRDIEMRDIHHEAVLLNMFYTSSLCESATATPPAFHNIHIQRLNCRGTGRSAIDIRGLPEKPICNVSFKDVMISSAKRGLNCQYVNHITLDRVSITPE